MHSAIISGSLGCSEINYKFNFDREKDDIIVDALGLGVKITWMQLNYKFSFDGKKDDIIVDALRLGLGGQDPLYKFQCGGI